jgi:ribose transport system ATP-binding protein
MTQLLLNLSNITKTFAGVTALSDVSLEVVAGEVHALLGENGAGKSTLMNVASGTLQPDGGRIEIMGQVVEKLHPSDAARLGLTIVHQHPAVLPDLSIAENIELSLGSELIGKGAAARQKMSQLLSDFGLQVELSNRVETLSVAQQHLLDLAKAFATNPKILILDEPTAPLGQESVEILFRRVKEITKTGTAVIYITHRLAEVRTLGDKVTILRDGRWSGSASVSELSDEQIMTMIVGRKLESAFPEKAGTNIGNENVLQVENISNSHLSNISVTAKRGEIIGIAGVVGNGQSDLLRVLAGLNSAKGGIKLNGKDISGKQLLKEAAYLPADRHEEGLMMTLSVRENAAINALGNFLRGPILSKAKENKGVLASLNELAVKAPSMDAAVSALSGGNQQKVVMSRSLLSSPKLIIADEPTQGVDVGARSEIYKILRDVSNQGIPVIVNSSDAKELEGLCDRVYVMSRGQVITELVGDEVKEAKMVAAAVQATTLKSEQANQTLNHGPLAKLKSLANSDFFPPSVLLGIIAILGLYIFTKNHLYFGSYNINAVLGLAAGLGFLALGETAVLMTGGIDMSVGPASGVLLCIASFFINDGKSLFMIVLGFILVFLGGAFSGVINGVLIRYAKFTPVAGTLTSYIGLIGLGFLLRPAPGGYMNATVTNALTAKIGPVPYVFIALAIAAFGMEYLLRRSRWGVKLRATGSKEESARRLGININRSVIGAYIVSGLFAALGAVMFIALIGVGDPAQGTPYTLQAITAVVLGGTSLLGGRGSFIGSLLGAILMVQVLNACVFLNLSQTWQYLFQGLLIVLAAISYTLTRSKR